MSSSRKTPVTTQGAAPTPAVVSSGKTTPRARRGVQQSLLLPAVSEAPRAPEPLAPTAVKRLWLCIYLPGLPLEALFRRDDGAAHAVFEEQRGIRRILKASACARAAGVTAGQPVNAALSLLPALVLEERNHRQEEKRVERLAAWAERFTSFVTIEWPDVLLLEVAGSERLFGGVETLRQKVSHGLGAQGLTTMLAIAPTPLASTWLARSGRDVCISEPSRLAGSLSRLPLDCLGWPPSVIESLGGMGIRGVGDCLRLPRQGFVRRFGARFLLQLDRAVGRLPDPRESYRAPETFSVDAELDAEEDRSECLLSVCRELLLKLERFLRTRQMRVQRMQFHFYHLQQEASLLALGRVQAGQDVDHWFDLLRIQFERMALPAPVIAIRLRGGQGQRSSMTTGNLGFTGATASGTASIDGLVERLVARMGDAAVHGLTAVAEHRPHQAWRRSSLLDDVPHCAATHMPGCWNEHGMPGLLHEFRRSGSLVLRRPLWMLETPRLLEQQEGLPVYQGTLTLLDGPERLESGWWDGAGIARDYFVARTNDGLHVWVYRDRHSDGAWYLHGMFG